MNESVCDVFASQGCRHSIQMEMRGEPTCHGCTVLAATVAALQRDNAALRNEIAKLQAVGTMCAELEMEVDDAQSAAIAAKNRCVELERALAVTEARAEALELRLDDYTELLAERAS